MLFGDRISSNRSYLRIASSISSLGQSRLLVWSGHSCPLPLTLILILISVLILTSVLQNRAPTHAAPVEERLQRRVRRTNKEPGFSRQGPLNPAVILSEACGFAPRIRMRSRRTPTRSTMPQAPQGILSMSRGRPRGGHEFVPHERPTRNTASAVEVRASGNCHPRPKRERQRRCSGRTWSSKRYRYVLLVHPGLVVEELRKRDGIVSENWWSAYAARRQETKETPHERGKRKKRAAA